MILLSVFINFQRCFERSHPHKKNEIKIIFLNFIKLLLSANRQASFAAAPVDNKAASDQTENTGILTLFLSPPGSSSAVKSDPDVAIKR